MEADTLAFLAWLAGFGAVTSLVWAAGRGRRGRVSVYPFAVVVRLGVSMEAERGGGVWRGVRLLGWGAVALMGLAMAMAYLGILSTAYAKYVARVEGAESLGVFPLIPGVTVDWGDLPYIMVALGVAVLVHEGAHAVLAVAEGVRVKNAGLALIGFVPAAFVEVDEDKFRESRLSTRAKVYSGGVAANLVLALIAGALAAHLSMGVFVVDVIGDPARQAGLQPGDVIVAVNGVPVRSVEQLSEALDKAGVKDPERAVDVTLTILRDGREIVVTVHKPQGEKLIGVKVTDWYTTPGLLAFSMYLINNALALINALPLFVTDGGQLLRDALERVAGRMGLTISVGIQAATLIIVASLISLGRLTLPG